MNGRTKKSVILTMAIAAAVCLAAGSLLTATEASAALTNIQSGGVTLAYDDATNEWWQPVLSRHEGNFAGAAASVDNDNTLSYGRINTWEIASRDQIEQLWDNFAGVNDVLEFFEPTVDEQFNLAWEAWSSSPNPSTPGDNILGLITYDIPGDEYDEGFFSLDRDGALGGAWVKSTTAPVPVPSTILLFGPGLMALAWIKRRFRHK